MPQEQGLEGRGARLGGASDADPTGGPRPWRALGDADDADLVRRCQRDRSPEAFRALYERHKDRVLNVVDHLIGDHDEALEAAQEVFLRVYRKIGHFRGQASFASWVYRIAVNVATDHRRRLGRERSLLQAYATEGPPAETWGAPAGGDTHQDAAQREQAVRVRWALSRLSPKLAAVVALRYLDGQAYSEIARTLRVSVGTVKSRLNRAHRALARLMEDLAPGWGEGQ